MNIDMISFKEGCRYDKRMASIGSIQLRDEGSTIHNWPAFIFLFNQPSKNVYSQAQAMLSHIANQSLVWSSMKTLDDSKSTLNHQKSDKEVQK